MSHMDILPEDIVNPVLFDRVPVYQNITENNKSYFIFTAYFVLPGTYKSGLVIYY